jgi:hypothetical protein
MTASLAIPAVATVPKPMDVPERLSTSPSFPQQYLLDRLTSSPSVQ